MIENVRYIKAKATLKGSNVTIIENLKVEEHEYEYEVFEKWKSKLLVNCGFEHIGQEQGDE